MLGTCCLKLRIINLSSIKINTIKELYPPILTDLFLGLSNARKYKTFPQRRDGLWEQNSIYSGSPC